MSDTTFTSAAYQAVSMQLADAKRELAEARKDCAYLDSRMVELHADIVGARAERDQIVSMDNAAMDKMQAMIREQSERIQQCAAENAALREALTDTIDMLEDLRDGTGELDREWLSGFVQQRIQVLRSALPISLPSQDTASIGASPPSEAQHLLAAGDPLPCDVTCEGFGTFHRGVKLGTLLGYLGRRRHYNTLPAPTEEQKAAFQRVLAEARGEHMECHSLKEKP